MHVTVYPAHPAGTLWNGESLKFDNVNDVTPIQDDGGLRTPSTWWAAGERVLWINMDTVVAVLVDNTEPRAEG